MSSWAFAQNDSVKTDVKKELDENRNMLRYDSIYSYFFSDSDSSYFNTPFFKKFGDGFGFSDSLFSSDEVYRQLMESFKGMDESFENFFKNDNFFGDMDRFFEEHFNNFFNQDNLDEFDRMFRENLKSFSDSNKNETDSFIVPAPPKEQNNERKPEKKKGVKI